MPNRGNERNAVCKHENWPRFNVYVYAGPFSHMLHLFIGLPVRATPNQELPSIYIKKRRNGGWNSQKALHVSSLFQRGRFLGRGWVILGCLANRLWSPLILVGTQNYCVGSKHLQIDQLIFASCGKHTTNYFVSLGIFMHQGNRTQR